MSWVKGLFAVLSCVSLAYSQSPTFSAGVTTGSIQNSSVNEASGIAASHRNYNVLWTHNDSGDSARLFPMTPAGANLGAYSISGASAVDWEDIAIGPGPLTNTQYIYAGDIGDNAAARADISVYRIPEPAVSALQPPTTTTIAGTKLTFSYPDGARDAESLFVDPLTRDIYIVTKREATNKRVYRAAYPQATSDPTPLEFVTTFAYSEWLTAADISPDGNEIIVRGQASARMYVRPPGGTIKNAFATTPISIPLLSDGQAEAIGFDPQGWGYYTTSEGSSRPINYFSRLPTRAVWITASGGYGTASNWDIGAVPGASHSLHFGATATGTGLTYTVNSSAATAGVAVVHRDNVTWGLSGATFTLTGFAGIDTLVVGGAFGENAALTLNIGTLTAGTAAGAFSQIGRGTGSNGVVNLTLGTTWNNAPPLLIGNMGSGALNVVNGSTCNFSSVYLGGTPNASGGGTGVFNVAGGNVNISGTLKAWNNATISWNGGSLNASAIELSGGGKMLLGAGGNKVLQVSSVAVDSASKLDLADNDLIVDYTGTSPLPAIRAMIITGYASGNWTGSGITSSSAAANSAETALGYGEDISTSVFVRYTYAGDANLDGGVDTVDFNALAASFGDPTIFWASGDFNYDGQVDTTDFNLLAANFGEVLAAPAMGKTIPEPGATSLALLGGAGLVARRRRDAQ